MQRMKLHVAGVNVAKLGSLKDRVTRSYLLKEAQLEAKRTEFSMLTLLTNPAISDDSKRREWVKSVQSNWKNYLGLLFYTEIPEETKEEEQMRDYYNRVVSKLKPKLVKEEAGLRLVGITAEDLG